MENQKELRFGTLSTTREELDRARQAIRLHPEVRAMVKMSVEQVLFALDNFTRFCTDPESFNIPTDRRVLKQAFIEEVTHGINIERRD